MDAICRGSSINVSAIPPNGVAARWPESWSAAVPAGHKPAGVEGPSIAAAQGCPLPVGSNWSVASRHQLTSFRDGADGPGSTFGPCWLD